MKRLVIAAVALLLGLAVPTLATAQLGPTNIPAPLTQPDPSDAQPAPVKEDEGLSTLQLFLMVGGSIAVLAAIAWFILRDARTAAPATERGRVADAAPATKKSARERERERARKRSKAKAVKNQRKRNRPR